ncbi:MAG: hypothetical protein KF819_33805 [Labilithrix sp.]|nr:hypothetical protein [Labilithrix sp.]
MGAAAVAAIACGSAGESPAEGDPDGSTEPGDAGGPGPGADGGREGAIGPEASVDASVEASVDASAEASADAGLTCTRELEARPAPASLFDVFKTDLMGLVGAARAARVDKLVADVAAQGGTPLENPTTGRVVFLVRGAPPEGTWSVTTSLVAFDPAMATPLAQVSDTDLYAADVTIARGASFEYKLLSGATFLEDRAAKNLVWDGIDRGTVGELNAIGHAMDWPMTKGRLRAHGKVHATMLGNDRDVYAYLPPKYDDGTCAKLPTVIFHDGNESLTRGDYAAKADALYAARPDLSAVLFFVALPSQDVRLDEYSFGFGGSKGLGYVDFLTTDLPPSLAAAGYRTCSKREARGIAGASLGGLISTFAAFEKPNAWGWVGSQSASYFWNGSAMITRVQNTTPKIDVRFYLDSGDAAADNVTYVSQMAAAMTTKGYDHVRVTAAGALHEWPDFGMRVGGMLTHFRDGRADCD